MKEELKAECYLLSLEGYRQEDIAKKLNVSRSTVTKAIQSITKGHDFQLAVKGCGVLIEEFVRYQDYCKKKLAELRDITPDDNRDRIAIIRLQNDLYKDLLTIGASGDFIQNVRKMRDKLGELETGSDVKQG